jgi:hypothetical protein
MLTAADIKKTPLQNVLLHRHMSDSEKRNAILLCTAEAIQNEKDLYCDLAVIQDDTCRSEIAAYFVQCCPELEISSAKLKIW